MEKFLYDSKDDNLIKEVYLHMKDDESKHIYASRSLFSLSDNREYMIDVIRSMSISKTMIEQINKNILHRKLVLFGCGQWGGNILQFFPEIKWDYVIDNNKAGQEICGYKISSINDVNDIFNCFVVIAVLFKYEEIEHMLLKTGLDKRNILTLGRIATEKQYFDLPYLNLGNQEVFIDAGGFNGDTSLQFNKITRGKYKNIYVFEPDRQLAHDAKIKLHELNNCAVIQKGLSNVEGRVKFIQDCEASRIVCNSIVCNKNYIDIETTSIDQFMSGDNVTFIKMDIEGSEMKALVGAKETITNYKPKLAISVYHKRSDIWKIPMLLLQYNPEYKFYLRIYSFTGNDTVLYAI